MLELLESRWLFASVAFIYSPPPGAPNPHALVFELDSQSVPAGASVLISDVADFDSPVAVESSMTTGTWSGGASAILTFPAYPGGVLPDGIYYGTLVDTSPSPQVVLGKTSFFVLSGDANHDQAVDITDLSILATNWQSSGRTYAEGDFNYDGTVDITDLSILATNWQRTSPTPPPVPVSGLQTDFDGTDLITDWDDNTEPGVTYNVYRATDPEFVPDPTGNRIATGLTVSAFADTAVSANERFYYRVTAVTTGGESYASELSTQVAAFGQQPAGLSAVAADEQRIEFSWLDSAADELGYTVEVLDSGNNVIQSVSLQPDAEYYSFSGLQEDTEYTVRVTANFAGDGQGPVGPTVSATTPARDSMVGLVIVILGHFQSLSRPNGMNALAAQLRADQFLGGNLRYRVWRAAEFVFADGGPDITWNGFGRIYDNAVTLLQANGTRDVAIIGYSHGGDMARKLTQNLINTRGPFDLWGIRYTAGIDAIQRGVIDNWLPAFAETRLPNSEHHANFYNDLPWDLFDNPLKGGVVPGAFRNVAINAVHNGIDDNTETIRPTIVGDIHSFIHPS